MKIVHAALVCCGLIFSAGTMAQPQPDEPHPQRVEMHRDYQRGHRMPDRFRGDDHVVSDYGQYHLRRPPHGYRWVRGDNNDFMLVALTSGIISQIIAGH